MSAYLDLPNPLESRSSATLSREILRSTQIRGAIDATFIRIYSRLDLNLSEIKILAKQLRDEDKRG